jgi:glutathione S-transferase
LKSPKNGQKNLWKSFEKKEPDLEFLGEKAWSRARRWATESTTAPTDAPRRRRGEKLAFSQSKNFSAADVYLGSQIGFGMMFGGIEKRPAFESYYARISRRPAALKARAIDDALVAERKRG